MKKKIHPEQERVETDIYICLTYIYVIYIYETDIYIYDGIEGKSKQANKHTKKSVLRTSLWRISLSFIYTYNSCLIFQCMDTYDHYNFFLYGI